MIGAGPTTTAIRSVVTVTATRADVAKVFAAAGFGATATELDTWTGRRYEDLVEHMLLVPAAAARPLSINDVVDGALTPTVAGGFGTEVRLWAPQLSWLERMRTTRYPLLERMTLLWHDHFATAYNPFPDEGMLVAQNATQRRHALGSFRDLVAAMTVDQAMLHWLNGAENATPYPNENYAREFFELFTLGKDPQVYTEADVREAARAFTGWTSDPNLRRVGFDAVRHDAGTKTILGRTVADRGPLEYLEVIDIALAQPVAATFIARKIVQALAYNPAPGDPLVTEVAADLRSTDWNLTAAVRTVLMSDRFRYGADGVALRRVRQPAEVVVNLFRGAGIPIVDYRIAQMLPALGQSLLDPPTVAGWPDGVRWLSPGTVIARYELAAVAVLFRDFFLNNRMVTPAPEDLDGWAARFGIAAWSSSTRSVLEGYLAETAGRGEDERRTGLLSLLVLSPEWTVV